ncbi:MAG: hypothetical protein JRG67_02455 [Deltaproteobacteria bacterium]|nr:hypothetical protein [Deltaproteobacteria bacterium]
MGSTSDLKIKSRKIDAFDDRWTLVAQWGADGVEEGSPRSNQRAGVLEYAPLCFTHAGRIFAPGPQ